MFYTTNPSRLEQLIQTHDAKWSQGMELNGMHLKEWDCHLIMY